MKKSLPMMFAMIELIDTIVPWFFGPGYDKVGMLVKVFSVLFLAVGISNVTGIQYLMAVNRQHVLMVCADGRYCFCDSDLIFD